jgi:hypothetical protein
MIGAFIFPCGIFMLTYALGFATCCWYFKRRYIAPLEWRIRQLESLIREPHTTAQPYKHVAPRTRYIPVENREY